VRIRWKIIASGEFDLDPSDMKDDDGMPMSLLDILKDQRELLENDPITFIDGVDVTIKAETEFAD